MPLLWGRPPGLPSVGRPGGLPHEEEGPLSGTTWVLTGTLSRWSRSAAETRIKFLGGRIADSVTKKTTHVVVGEAPGSKLARAQQLGIPILDEEAFEKDAGAPS